MADQKVTDFGSGLTSGLKVYGARGALDTGAELGNAAGSDTGKFISDTGKGAPGFPALATDTGKFVADTGSANNFLKNNVENQSVSGGATITPKDLGVGSGTVTLDVGDRPLQKVTNNTAFTLAPGTVKGSTILEVINSASTPGVITISGFSGSSGAFDTGKGGVWHCGVSVGDSGSFISINQVQAGT